MIKLGPGRLLARLLIVLPIGLLLGLGGGAWCLAHGPLSLAWALPWLEQSLNQSMTGTELKLSSAQLVWERKERTLSFELADLTLVNANPGNIDRSPILFLPKARIRFDPKALLRGTVAPTDILAQGLTVDLYREEDGSIGVETALQGASSSDWRSLLHKTNLAASGFAASLQRILLSEVKIRLNDRMTDRLWSAERAELVLRQTPAGLEVSAKLDLNLDGQATRVESDALWRQAASADASVDDLIDIRFEILDLNPRSFADLFSQHRDILSAIDIPLTAKGEMRGSLALGVERAFVRLSAKAGRLIDPRLVGGLLNVMELGADLSWSQQEGGNIDLSNATLQLETGDTLSANLSLQQATEAAILQGKATLTDLSVDRLASLWPEELAPNPRQWILAHLSLGQVLEAKIAFDLARPQADTPFDIRKIEGSIDFTGVRATYFHDLPAAENIKGRAQFNQERMTVTVDSARMLGIKIQPSDLVITGLDREIQTLTILLNVSGPLSDALSVLDRPPLGYMKQLAISPRSVGGKMTTKLRFAFPLIQDLRLQDVKLAVTSQITEAKLLKIVHGHDLTDATLSLTLTAKGLEMAGNGLISRIPAKLAWAESFEKNAKLLRKINLTATLGDEDRERIDLSFAPYVSGPVTVEAVYSEYASHEEIKGQAILDRSALALKEFGWKKPPGTAALGRFQLSLKRGELFSLDSLELESAAPDSQTSPLKASLTAQIENGTLSEVKIHSFQLAPTELAGTVTLRPQGGFDATLHGSAIDVRSLLADWPSERTTQEAKSPSPQPPFSLNGQFDRVVLSKDGQMEGLRLTLAHDGLRPVLLDLDARVALGAKNTDLKIALLPSPEGRKLSLHSDNAGIVLRAMNLTHSIIDGDVTVSGVYSDPNNDDRLQGRIVMSNYRIIDMPVLAQLLAFISITGIPDLLSGEGVAFRSLKTDFTYDNRTLEIIKAEATGLALGINLRGRIRQPGKIADLEGTLIPVYVLNNAFASIPLLGNLLTGERAKGVFAWTYRITGPLADPEVKVDLLSVLAPGFLQNLFTGADPGASQ